MNIKITGNIEITPALKDNIEKKIIKKVEKFSDYIKDINISLTVEKGKTDKHEVKILTSLKNQKHARVNKVSASAENMYKSIDLASDKVFKQITKFKNKTKNYEDIYINDLTNLENNLVDLNYDTDENEQFDIVKIKRFDLKPSFIEDAIVEMNKLGHNFFLYLDASTNYPCIVYRRKNGGYGIIEY